MSTITSTDLLAVLNGLIAEIKELSAGRALVAAGAQEPVRPLQRILLGLLESSVHRAGLDQGNEISRAHLQVVTDLVNGVYGPELLVDTVLELEADRHGPGRFRDRTFVLSSLAVSRAALVRERLCPKTDDGWQNTPRRIEFAELFTKLVDTDKSWAHDRAIALAAGVYGPELQIQAVRILVTGVPLGGSPTSFSNACALVGRIRLLSSVADLHETLPPGLIAGLMTMNGRALEEATTDGGRWLDLLSHMSDREGREGQGRYKSFAAMLGMLTFDSKKAYGQAVAEILAKHDPDHKGIAALEGTVVHSYIVEATMNRRIDAKMAPSQATLQASSPAPDTDSVSATAQQGDAAPIRRNRSV